MLSGSPPLEAGGGLRALLNMPRGVEEAVIELVMGGSDADRKEGIRGMFVVSVGEIPGATSGLRDSVPVAKSWESSGAGGAVFGRAAIVVRFYMYRMREKSRVDVVLESVI